MRNKQEQKVIDLHYKDEDDLGTFYGLQINSKRTKKFLFSLISWLIKENQRLIKERDKWEKL